MQAVERGIIQTIENDFDAAEQTFQALIASHPDKPYGYFYLGATLQAKMLDLEDFEQYESFQAMMESSIETSEVLLKSDKGQIWPMFFIGSAYLYRSFLDSKRGKMWSGYRNASKGSGWLEKLIKMDSTFYDAYLGVGSFKYWKSSKAKVLAWLPFISDERDTGVEMVQTAVAKGSFVKLVGRDQLAWILMDRGEYPAALELAESNYSLHPLSRFFAWTLVEIYFRLEKWDEASALYRELLDDLRSRPEENNHFNELGCLVKMADIQLAQGEYESAEHLAREGLSLEIEETVHKRAKKRLQRAEEILRECRSARMQRSGK